MSDEDMNHNPTKTAQLCHFQFDWVIFLTPCSYVDANSFDVIALKEEMYAAENYWQFVL